MTTYYVRLKMKSVKRIKQQCIHLVEIQDSGKRDKIEHVRLSFELHALSLLFDFGFISKI